MARRRKPRAGDVEVTQEEQWQQHRGRCRGPAQWQNYTNDELFEMHARAKRLREQGYGSDVEYQDWLVKLWGEK